MNCFWATSINFCHFSNGTPCNCIAKYLTSVLTLIVSNSVPEGQKTLSYVFWKGDKILTWKTTQFVQIEVSDIPSLMNDDSNQVLNRDNDFSRKNVWRRRRNSWKMPQQIWWMLFWCYREKLCIRVPKNVRKVPVQMFFKVALKVFIQSRVLIGDQFEWRPPSEDFSNL